LDKLDLTFEAACKNSKLNDLLLEEIKSNCEKAGFARFEIPKYIHIHPTPFTLENGLLNDTAPSMITGPIIIRPINPLDSNNGYYNNKVSSHSYELEGDDIHTMSKRLYIKAIRNMSISKDKKQSQWTT
ncbi:hypothetical protein K502DRAFT_352054, partial [Neoconidiobolus thromboides FSU 785]